MRPAHDLIRILHCGVMIADESVSPMPQLRNRRHECFAREIAAMAPFASAYASAGYSGDPQWFRYNASRLANKPEVKARIAELQDEFNQSAAIHASYIQQKLLPLIESNVQDFYIVDADGKERLRSISELPRLLAAAVTQIKFNESGGLAEIKLADKNAVATTLLRSVGGLVDRSELTGAGGGPLNFATVVDEAMALVMQRREARGTEEARQAQPNASEPNK